MKIKFLSLAAILFINLIAQGQTWQWANQAGGQIWDEPYSIHESADGNVYITGRFMADGVFGSDTITSNGNLRDIFVAKYDTAGNYLWAKKVAGSGDGFDHGTGIVTDGFGGVYVTGYFEGLAVFDTITVIANSSAADIFLAKYNVNGDIQWVKHFDSGNTTFSSSFKVQIEVDDEANLYLQGHFQGTFPADSVLFDGEYLSVQHDKAIFLAKYDSTGTKQWISTADGTAFSSYFGLSTDVDGRSFVVGQFSDSAFFENDTLITNEALGLFIAAYDNNGALLWTNIAEGTTVFCEAQDVTADGNGNVYFSGLLSDSIFFNSDTLVSTTEERTFLAKYDYNGNEIWTQRMPGSDRNRIAADSDGNCFMACTFEESDGPISIAGGTLTATGFVDIYIVRLDAAGNELEAVQAEGDPSWYFQPTEMDVDELGGSYITGFFIGNSTYGSIPLNSYDPGSNNIFLAKAQFPVTALNINTIEDKGFPVVVYPNPSTGIFHIEIAESLGGNVSVYNQLGSLVEEVDFSDQNVELDLSHLPNGIYILKIQNGDSIQLARIVKQ